jgi:hypothetical protein
MIAKAFKHLLDVGESLEWVDRYIDSLPVVTADRIPLIRWQKFKRVSSERGKENRERIACLMRHAIQRDRSRKMKKYRELLIRTRMAEREARKAKLRLEKSMELTEEV